MHDWQKREQSKLQSLIEKETYQGDGALYWKSNDRPVPMHTFRDAGLEPPAGQARATKESTEAAIEAYRQAMKGYQPSEQEKAEWANQLGANARIVNVLTGQVFYAKAPKRGKGRSR
jgi:hypothetical protein